MEIPKFRSSGNFPSQGSKFKICLQHPAVGVVDVAAVAAIVAAAESEHQATVVVAVDSAFAVEFAFAAVNLAVVELVSAAVEVADVVAGPQHVTLAIDQALPVAQGSALPGSAFPPDACSTDAQSSV